VLLRITRFAVAGRGLNAGCGAKRASAQTVVLALCIHAALLRPLLSQTPAFSIYPMRMEMEVNSGTEKTAAFEIRAAAANVPERGRLLLSLTDWIVRENGSVAYAEPGSTERSACPWIIFSPTAMSTEPGRSQLVRITVKVPEKTAPGVYRSGIFVQERPPAKPPGKDERVILLRVRYEFTLYVIVPPVSAHLELVDLEVDGNSHPLRLICEMKNTGNGYVRPLVSWTIRRRGPAADAGFKGKKEATVLLPFATLREAYYLANVTTAPGAYEAMVIVDFQDGQPLQSMTRPFDVADTPPPEPAVPPAIPPEIPKVESTAVPN
jgi:hypothetical protein